MSAVEREGKPREEKCRDPSLLGSHQEECVGLQGHAAKVTSKAGGQRIYDRDIIRR
jgi:hypothetical protein